MIFEPLLNSVGIDQGRYNKTHGDKLRMVLGQKLGMN